jgi:phage terminase small subunit
MAGAKGRSGGHNKKSLAELRLAGTYRRDRHESRARLPDNRGFGPPTPRHKLTAEQNAVWQMVVPSLAEAGIVCELDSALLTGFCVWHAREIEICRELSAALPSGDAKAMKAWQRMANMAAKICRKIEHDSGLTPAARRAHGWPDPVQ